MRRILPFLGIGLIIALGGMAQAKPAPDSTNAPKDSAPQQIDITADESLEWYQDQHIYLARGKAKAIRGDSTIEADLLTAHEREAPASAEPRPAPTKSTNESGGTLDKMTAEGHVRISNPTQVVTGDHAVYDYDTHVAVVTGDYLKYATEKETVTATDSLEYWEDKKLAIARGNAVGIQGDRHVEGDTLTAEFRDNANNQQELWKMTAVGHVTIITKSDVSRGDKGVYDVARNIAILTGNVRITRADGTQLTGDVGEVDFTNNQSRLMNQGSHRVRALLTPKTTNKAEETP